MVKQRSNAQKDSYSSHIFTEDERRYKKNHPRNSFRGFCSICHTQGNPVYFKIPDWTTFNNAPAHKKCVRNLDSETRTGPFFAICRAKTCDYIFWGKSQDQIQTLSEIHYLKKHNPSYGPYDAYPLDINDFSILEKKAGDKQAKANLIKRFKEVYAKKAKIVSSL